jgi:cystathionine beta-synthase
VRDAIGLMRQHSISQLPVAAGEMPLAVAEVKGSVDELRLMDLVFANDAALETTLSEVMSPPLPTIGIGQTIGMAVEMLDAAAALLVIDGGRPRTIISRSDVLGFLSAAHQGEC